MSNYCKYYKQQKQVSYNSGATWQNVVPPEYRKGELYEEDSMDCAQGAAIFRWVLVPGDFICDGKDKYEKEIEQYSTDGGITFTNVYPTTYRKGRLIETNSEICNNKWEGHYVDQTGGEEHVQCPRRYRYFPGIGCVYVDPVKFIRCTSSSSTTLTRSEVQYPPYILFEGIIGDCVTDIGGAAFYEERSLTGITIPDTVETIGQSAFSKCRSLEYVDFGSGLKSIGGYAFEGCTGLTSVTIPGSANIGYEAFGYCSELTEVTIQTDSSSSATSIDEWAFTGCGNLRRVTIGNNVESIGAYSFLGDSALTTVQLGSNINSIGYEAFYNCSGLTSISIPNGVTGISSNTFYNCVSLSSLTLSNSLVDIGTNAFHGCKSLSDVSLPDTLTTIGGSSFWGCSGLTSITIPSGVTLIDGYAFGNCTSLTSITVNAVMPPTIGGSSTFDNTNNCPIYVPCESVGRYHSAWSYYKNRIQGIQPCVLSYKLQATYSDSTMYEIVCNDSSTLTYSEVTGHSTSNSAMTSAVVGECVTVIDSRAFLGCTSLSSVTISEGVEIISGSVSSYGAFQGCGSLTGVSIPSTVTTIENKAFQGCSGMTALNIGSGVTSIGMSAFANCYSLTNLTIPSGVTTLGGMGTVAGGSFEGCSGLTSVTIGEGITTIGKNAFNGCSSLSAITINTTTPPYLGTSAFTNTNDCPIYVPCESYMTYLSKSDWSSYTSRIQPIPPCEGSHYKLNAKLNDDSQYIIQCNSSTTLVYNEMNQIRSSIVEGNIGDCVTSIGTNTAGYGVFGGCTSLTSVTIPGLVTLLGYSAFSGCTSLPSVVIPDSVTSIDDYAFYKCTSLTSVTIGNGVTQIDRNAFSGCSSLTGVTINAVTPPTLGNNAFHYTNSCPIYVPCESVSAYTTASSWSSYVNRIQGIPPCSTPSTPFKLKASYPDSTTYKVDCNSSATLTTGETRGHSSAYASMTSAEVGECVNTIGQDAFSSCYGLTSITISSGVTTIGRYAFFGCSGLTSVTIPNTVTSIEYVAFSDCSSLNEIRCLSTTPPTLGNNVFSNTNNCPIYVPANSVYTYKSATKWSNYADRIQAIPT